jgi:hypothetical protein
MLFRDITDDAEENAGPAFGKAATVDLDWESFASLSLVNRLESVPAGVCQRHAFSDSRRRFWRHQVVDRDGEQLPLGIAVGRLGHGVGAHDAPATRINQQNDVRQVLDEPRDPGQGGLARWPR